MKKDFLIDVRTDANAAKLNVNAPEFTINRDIQNVAPIGFFPTNAQLLQHSKSSGNMQQQIQLAAARRHALQMANLATPRTILVAHPLQQMQQMSLGASVPQAQYSQTSNGNVSFV